MRSKGKAESSIACSGSDMSESNEQNRTVDVVEVSGSCAWRVELSRVSLRLDVGARRETEIDERSGDAKMRGYERNGDDTD